MLVTFPGMADTRKEGNDVQNHTPQLPLFPSETLKQCRDKNCPRAGEWLPISEFNVNRALNGGHDRMCRECAKRKLREYRATEKGKRAAALWMREYRKTPNGRKHDRKGREKYRAKDKYRALQVERRKRDPLKSKARYRLNSAVKYGHLARPDSLPCHECGEPACDYHHHLGYEPEHHFDVIPVCRPCHAKLHHAHLPRKY